jgi:Predicted 3'-5' exonuclease related to the exonuclease domain of PolB
MLLREICAVLDMPFEGLDDDDVERFAQQERFMEIVNYCEREAKSIFQIWLRHQLYDGAMSYHDFRQSDGSPASSSPTVAFQSRHKDQSRRFRWPSKIHK